MVGSSRISTYTLLTTSHLLLIGLIGSVGVILTILLLLAVLWLLLLLTILRLPIRSLCLLWFWITSIVAGMTLRVGGIICAILTTLLTVLEPAMLRRSIGVLSARWTKVLTGLWIGVGIVVAVVIVVAAVLGLLGIPLLLTVALVVV